MQMKRAIMQLPAGDNDKLAKLIYESIHGENDYNVPQKWEDTAYMAPETTPGYMARMIKFAANQIRNNFVVTEL